ncbi:MAG TPA: hypothetical protein EYG68_00585 [Leucothrix mucor]|nr:hypothetical protein [Leucothrix mucor]
MNISDELFEEIFDAALKKSCDEYDGSNSHALCHIIEVVDGYREKHPEIDEEIKNLIVIRIFTPPHIAFPQEG